MVPVAIANGCGAVDTAYVADAEADLAGIVDGPPLDVVAATRMLAAKHGGQVPGVASAVCATQLGGIDPEGQARGAEQGLG